MQNIPRPASFDGFPSLETMVRNMIQIVRAQKYKYLTAKGVETLLNDCLRLSGLPEEPR